MEKRKIVQYHAIGWPDKKVPKPEFLDYLHEQLSNILGFIDEPANINKPVVVHCSAGVGRTGTFTSQYYLTSQVSYYKKKGMLNSGKDCVSVFGTVRSLREQRMMMVQNFKQYEYIYDFMEMLIKKNLG